MIVTSYQRKVQHAVIFTYRYLFHIMTLYGLWIVSTELYKREFVKLKLKLLLFVEWN